MIIKILDVCEADMRKAEARFKNEVSVKDGEDPELYDLVFSEGCTMTTHVRPAEQLIIYNSNSEACLCLFTSDFSEVHII